MSIFTNLEFNRYRDLPGTELPFDQDMLMRVEQLASGLSPEEIMQYWGLTLAQLCPADLDHFFVAYNRGISSAKSRAVDKLFSAMGDKNGGVFALKYLEIFADKFAESEAASNLNHGYTLQIVPTVSDNPATKAINGNREPKLKAKKPASQSDSSKSSAKSSH